MSAGRASARVVTKALRNSIVNMDGSVGAPRADRYPKNAISVKPSALHSRTAALSAKNMVPLQAKRFDQRRKRSRVLLSARVIEEEFGEWLAPIIEHADQFAAFELRFHALI